MSEAKGSSGQPGPVTDPSSVEMAADKEELTALEKIVIDTRKFEDEDEDDEEGTVVTESVVSQEREVMPPLGVQLLELEQQRERAKIRSKTSSRVTATMPFNATSTRSFEKKVKAHIERVTAEPRPRSTRPTGAASVSEHKAVEEINRLSVTLDGLRRDLAVDQEDLTQVRILERALEENFPETLLDDLAVVPQNNSAEEEDGDAMGAHWKAFEMVGSLLEQEIDELAKLSTQHSRLMEKIHLRMHRMGDICRDKMRSTQRSLRSYRERNETQQRQIDDLTRKVEYLTEVASVGSQERKRLEKKLGSSNDALSKRSANSSNLMAKYFAEKTILVSELSIYKQQILRLKEDREAAVLAATKSLSSDLTVALSEWESMEQKLLILEHQVKKAQADSSDSLVRLHKNATVQTEASVGKEPPTGLLASSSSSDMLSANESEADVGVETTLGSWGLMYVSVGQNQSIQWVLSTIAALYNDAISNDSFIKFSALGAGHTFKDFVRRWHFTRYGLPHVAETNLADLIISVHRIARTSMSVRMFAYFCGIWDYRDKIYNEQITFVLYAMQCLSKSKDVSCLFPDEGNFWVKPLDCYTMMCQIFATMNSEENVRTFMTNHVEQLLDPIMDMYKSEDILFAMHAQWERARNKMCAKLEAFYNFAVPEGQKMLSYDEFAMILGKIAINTDVPAAINVTSVYDECRSLCLETKEMTFEIVEKAILKYGIGLWRLKSFPEILQAKLPDQMSWSKNKMPQKVTGNPLFNILDHILRSKLFDMSVADADELKVKLGVQSTIVRKFVETYDALIREYKDRVDAEQAWKLYRLFISQVNSGRKSNGYFWTRISEIGHDQMETMPLEEEESGMTSSDDPTDGELSPLNLGRSPGSEAGLSGQPSLSPAEAREAGSLSTANFLIGNF